MKTLLERTGPRWPTEPQGEGAGKDRFWRAPATSGHASETREAGAALCCPARCVCEVPTGGAGERAPNAVSLQSITLAPNNTGPRPTPRRAASLSGTNTMNTSTQTPEPPASAEIVNEQSLLEEIAQLHGQITGLAESAMEKAIRIGTALLTLKSKKKHGEWQSFVADALPFCDRTASNYLRIAQAKQDQQLPGETDSKTLEQLLRSMAKQKKPNKPEAPPSSPDVGTTNAAGEATGNEVQSPGPQIPKNGPPEPETNQHPQSKPAPRTVTSFTDFVTERKGHTRYTFVAVDLEKHTGTEWDLAPLNSALESNACVAVRLNSRDIPRAFQSGDKCFNSEGLVAVTDEEAPLIDGSVPISLVLLKLKGHSIHRGRLPQVVLNASGVSWYEAVLGYVVKSLEEEMPKKALLYSADDLIQSDQAA